MEVQNLIDEEPLLINILDRVSTKWFKSFLIEQDDTSSLGSKEKFPHHSRSFAQTRC